MNEKKMARNALPWSSRPTFGPTASVRTIRYCAAPRPCASAESTAAAGELDRVVQPVHQEQGKPGDDEGRGEAVGPAAPFDEVVVGVGEEADHVRRSG